MRGWLILAIILLCLWLIGMIRAQVVLIFNGDLALKVKVLGMTIQIMPKKPKKALNPDDFSPKKYRKLLAKEAKRQAKKEAKKAKSKLKKDEKATKKKKAKEEAASKAPKKPKKKKGLADILDLVYMGVAALKSLGKSFGKHFEIEAVRLRIIVGSEDAAQTALLYGILAQAVAYFLEILSSVTNLRIRKPNRGNILVDADFTSEKIEADLHLIFKMRVWHLFAMVFSALGGIIKNRIAKIKKPASIADQAVSNENS